MTDTTDPNERLLRQKADELRRIAADIEGSVPGAAGTFETPGGELLKPPQEEPDWHGKVKPPKGKVLLLTCCMDTDVLQKVCKREGFEPCVYVLTNKIDPDHDLVPDPEATEQRAREWLSEFQEAKYLCFDWENPLHGFLKGEWWCLDAAVLSFRQLREYIRRQLPRLLVAEWGLPTLPWHVNYDGRKYRINDPGLPKSALWPALDDAAKSQYTWDHCDWLCPAVYTHHRSTEEGMVDLWKFVVETKIQICRDVARGKPIYPCLCPFDADNFTMDEEQGGGPPLYGLTADDLLSVEEWKEVLKHVASFQPAGASMWCVEAWWGMVPGRTLSYYLDLMEEILLR